MTGQEERVYVGHVATPDAFFVSPVRNIFASDDLKVILALEDDLARNRAALSKLKTGDIEGKFVAVPCDDDLKIWRRGKVITLRTSPSGVICKILLLDTGDRLENVPAKRLRKLPSGMKRIPPLAKKFRIKGQNPVRSRFNCVTLVLCF